MASANLATIRTKIRRLTRTPSTSQLSDSEIDQYINTFISFDFPQHLRLKTLKTTLTWYTKPNIDTYTTNTTDPDDPLYNFKNKYISVEEPMYIGGYRAFYTQSREQFFNIYPSINYIQQIALGNSAGTRLFTGTLNAHPIIRSNVIFSSIDSDGFPLVLVDYPLGQNPQLGNPISRPG